MKNKLILIACIISLFAACTSSDDYDAPNSFSDVSWYTSAFRSATMGVSVNDFASFADLSQGELSHSWTIEEGSFFLEGPITRTDSVYDKFIIEPRTLETEDKTVHVLFTEGGLKKVRLYNVFKDSVAFKGANDFIFPSKRESGQWVIDTTFIVDVYDTIVPQILIRQNGVVVPHESASDIITVEAGSTLELVDITTIGRPNTRSWNIAGITNTDSLAVIQFNKLGEFNGNLNISRQGEEIPGDYENYIIPATINVIPSSLPFEVSADIIELENQTIQVPFNGEFAPFGEQESFFTVNVNGSPFTISSVSKGTIDATKLEIKLVDQIYRSDVITVSYDGNGDLESSDTRTPLAFTDLPVSMFQHELAKFDFETNTANYTAHAENLATTSIEISTEQAASGTNSIKIDAGASGNWSVFENLVDQFSATVGQKIQVEYKVYKVSGASINFLAPWLSQDGAVGGGNTSQFWHNNIQGVATDAWVTIRAGNVTTVSATANNYNLYFRHNGSGTIYLDDIRFIEVDDRP
ncbi:hypothetical protein [Algibacter lectus]|uniref:hypothetical protein n=1 Tax=Algibacter lectus TaxID=221126 RepID=UPI0026EB9F44|nr:hypothetical protein [Algibacter lectus]MDO7135826.1 hypothetical protein [Algibacter lectus]